MNNEKQLEELGIKTDHEGSIVHTINGEKIYIDGYLKKKLDKMLEYQRKDFDVCTTFTGKEGSGKSTLALICAWYLTNGKFGVDNIVEGTEDVVEKLDKAKKGSVLIIDEGSLLFSSRETMSKEQRSVTKILNVLRQKNIILFIVAPSFFDLSKYIAVHRSNCLINVYVKGLRRGRFAYFNESKKKSLYLHGKKQNNNYEAVSPLFRGRFLDFRPPFHEEYLKTKERSLMLAISRGYGNETKDKPTTEHDLKVKLAKEMRANNPKMTLKQIGAIMSVTDRTILRWFQEENEWK